MPMSVGGGIIRFFDECKGEPFEFKRRREEDCLRWDRVMEPFLLSSGCRYLQDSASSGGMTAWSSYLTMRNPIKYS